MKHIVLILAAIAILAGCKDAGTQPETPVAQWKEIAGVNIVRSGWLNFISVQAGVEAKPDSAMLVIANNRRAYAQEILGGAGSIVARFYFEPGYVSSLAPNATTHFFIK